MGEQGNLLEVLLDNHQVADQDTRLVVEDIRIVVQVQDNRGYLLLGIRRLHLDIQHLSVMDMKELLHIQHQELLHAPCNS